MIKKVQLQMKYFAFLLCCLLSNGAFAVSLEKNDLPKPVLSKDNGPDIGLDAKSIKARYGKNATGQDSPLLFSFNLLAATQLDVLIVIKEGKVMLASYTSNKRSNVKLGDDVVDFLVKKNFPVTKWVKEDPIKLSSKHFISEDGKCSWALGPAGSQLVLIKTSSGRPAKVSKKKPGTRDELIAGLMVEMELNPKQEKLFLKKMKQEKAHVKQNFEDVKSDRIRNPNLPNSLLVRHIDRINAGYYEAIRTDLKRYLNNEQMTLWDNFIKLNMINPAK